MSKVVYRGVTYDAGEVKDQVNNWWKSCHKTTTYTYRGQSYEGIKVDFNSLVSQLSAVVD